ncbi:MAG: hypothetical protein ACQERJ_00265, partial [Bacillota bacterium]
MKNKKGIVLAVLVALSLTFVGCGGVPENPTPPEEQEMQEQEQEMQEQEEEMQEQEEEMQEQEE